MSIRRLGSIPFGAAALVAGVLLCLAACGSAGTLGEGASLVQTIPPAQPSPDSGVALTQRSPPPDASSATEGFKRPQTRPTTKRQIRAQARPTVVAKSSRFGSILFDGRGYVLYAFTRDRQRQSSCRGACAAAWPPYLARGILNVGRGLDRSLLGTTRRADGKRQVTYAGRPLYYYVGDQKPGQILCQNVDEFGGLWLVVRPSGKLVR